MNHPLQSVLTNNFQKVFFPLLITTIVLYIVLQAIPLKPNIIKFELNARQVIESWDSIDKMWAAFSLGLDFLFLVIYSTTLSLACLWVANRLQNSDLILANIGFLLAWGQWLAALLDVIENIALLKILFNPVTTALTQTAKWFAIGKFFLIILGLVYVIVGSSISLRK